MIPALVLGLLLAQLAAAPTKAPAAEALVRALYKPQSLPSTKADLDQFFAHDLASALLKDQHPGDVGQIDFDYRYAAQEIEIARLAFDSRAVIGGSVTTVSFRNFGHPTKVIYRLCQRIGGDWRIYQVQSVSFDLRRLLKLPASPVGC